MIDYEQRKKESKAAAAALRRAGVQVKSVFDLVNTSTPYPGAIPVLIGLLSTVKEGWIKQGVVRALTVKEARPVAAKPLIREFRRETDDRLSPKWAIGNALSVVADDSVFDDVVDLVTDRRHGKAREMLAVTLGSMKNPRAVDVLVGLLQDDEVAGHAITGLRKLKAVQARTAIQPFLKHPKAWVRREARKALNAIDRAASRQARAEGH